MTLLQLQDVTYRYKNTAEAVLYQINYNYESGKFYSIIGESGAEKSTLLSLLACLDSPVSSFHGFAKGSRANQSPVSSLYLAGILSDFPLGSLHLCSDHYCPDFGNQAGDPSNDGTGYPSAIARGL